MSRSKRGGNPPARRAETRETERARERRERGLTPAGLPAEPAGPVRPPRPVTVELAAAIMIVTGAMAAFTSVESAIAMVSRNEASAPLALAVLLLAIALVVLGILVRFGRAWLVAVNVTAVTAFLELTSGTAPGFLFGGLDILVVVLLMRERPWFYWSPDGEDEDEDEDEEG